MLDGNPDDLSYIPGAHTGDGENWFLKLSSDHTCAVVCSRTQIHRNVKESEDIREFRICTRLRIHPQYCINARWCGTPVTPTLQRQRQKDQLHSKGQWAEREGGTGWNRDKERQRDRGRPLSSPSGGTIFFGTLLG